MTIKKSCLTKILSIMQGKQTLKVEIMVNGVKKADAEILQDGRVQMLPSGQVYDSPSAMRDTVVGSNRGTYEYIFYHGKSLRDWGVKP